MDIGTEKETIVIEPIENPQPGAPEREPVEPETTPIVAPEPEKVPA